jgi:hypothetical protein
LDGWGSEYLSMSYRPRVNLYVSTPVLQNRALANSAKGIDSEPTPMGLAGIILTTQLSISTAYLVRSSSMAQPILNLT